MDFLILFLILSTISINGIDRDKHCSEQKCISDLSQWCCPYNTTCGSVDMCNDIAQARSTSYCIGSVACISGQYYWCCDNDQRCGGFRKCNGGSLSSSQTTLIATILSTAILIAVCSAYCRYRYLKNNNNNGRTLWASRNQRAQGPVYLSVNSPTTTANPYGQVYTIPTHPEHVMKRETPPPTYDMAITSTTTQNKDRI